jgi:hypothetical protein
MSKQIDVQSNGTPVVSGLVNAALSLVSSNEPGEVKIDTDTGVMAVNPVTYSTAERATGETWTDGKPIYRKSATYTRAAGGAAGDIVTLMTYPGNASKAIRIEGLYTPDGFGHDYTPIGAEFSVNGQIQAKWQNQGNGQIRVLFPYANTYYMNIVVHVWYYKNS